MAEKENYQLKINEQVSKIKGRMESNGQLKLWLFSDDFFPGDERPDEGWGEGEFRFASQYGYDGDECQCYYIRRVSLQGGKLLLDIAQTSERSNGSYRTIRFFSRQTVEDIVQSASTVWESPKGLLYTLEYIANYVFAEDDKEYLTWLIELNRKYPNFHITTK